MKFHPSLIEKLVKTYEVYAGWRDEVKLKNALAAINITTYTQQDGTEVLVDQDQLEKAIKNLQTGN